MPRMSAPRCAAVMCGVRASERVSYKGHGMPADYETGVYGNIARMARAGATNEEICSAYPEWRGCIAAIRDAVGKIKKP